MKIVSFNINSIRARPHQLEQITAALGPDILCLQETKVIDESFPHEVVQELGYKALVHGQKGHYGVATLYRPQAVEIVQHHRGLPGDSDDEQRRLLRSLIQTDAGPVWLFNGYFPQGENRAHEVKFPYKERFYRRLTDFVHRQHSADEPLIVLGDLNISPADSDIGIGEDNRKRWLREGKCSFLPEERQWLQKLTARGLTDTWRYHNPSVSDRYSWFDYRSGGFQDEPKRGLRLDHIWASDGLMPLLKTTGIDYEARAMERPSDHCPVWAEFTG